MAIIQSDPDLESLVTIESGICGIKNNGYLNAHNEFLVCD